MRSTSFVATCSPIRAARIRDCGICTLLLGLALFTSWLANCHSTNAAAITWNVAGGGVWDTTTANWTPNPTYANGDAVTFNNTTGGVINLTADRAPLSTTVSATSGTYTFSGSNITSGTLSKSNAGILVLNSAANVTSVANAGGTIQFSASNRFPSTVNYSGGGVWDMNGFSQTVNGIGTTVKIINLGALTVTAGGDWTGGTTLTGSGSLTQNGGIIYLSGAGANTYTGGTTVNAGATLNLYAGVNVLPTTGDVAVNGTGVLNLNYHNGAGNLTTIDALSGNGQVKSSSTDLANSSFVIGNNGDTATFSGFYSGAGSLTKVGAGIQTMSGNNTYTGTTTVSGGTLIINGTTGPGQGNYSVANTAKLGGSGTIGLAGGNSVTVANGGILAPGNSAGTLTINGNLILNNTSNLQWELGTAANPSTSDKTVVNGNLTLDGILNVTWLAPVNDGTYTLFSYTGTLLNNGLTVNDPDGLYTLDTNTPGLVLLLVEIPVPEPSTSALLGLGIVGLAVKARRRRRVWAARSAPLTSRIDLAGQSRAPK